MDQQNILRALRADLSLAQQRREEDARRLDEALLDAARGAARPEEFESAKTRYRYSRERVHEALMRLASYQTRCAVAPELGRGLFVVAPAAGSSRDHTQNTKFDS